MKRVFKVSQALSFGLTKQTSKNVANTTFNTQCTIIYQLFPHMTSSAKTLSCYWTT